MQFPVGMDDKSGNINIGFYRPKSHDIVDVDSRYIQHPVNDEIVKKIKMWMKIIILLHTMKKR